jgi:FkbM family methyltransferase
MKFILQTFFKGLYYFLSDASFRTFVRLSVLYGSSKRYVRRSISIKGAKMEVADAKSFIWQYYEIFFKSYYDFKANKKNPLIIDCGSNIGLGLLRFKQQYPEADIHAFEADDLICNILNKNIAANQLKGIHVHNEAVWIKDETLQFASEGADGGQISENNEGTKSVNGIDFARFLQRFEQIDFLKIDIEGAETQLLPHIASQLHKVDNLFVEFHSYNGQTQHLNEVIAAMSSAGHRIYIDNVAFKNSPFINKTGKYGMDLQLNIFAYKQ